MQNFFSRFRMVVIGASLIAAFVFGALVQAGESAQDPVRILAFGDSLTAGYGLEESQSFPAVLERELTRLGHNVRVINSGVSGDTTAAGLARLQWSLLDQPDIVVLALGANDALRGLDPAQTRRNLEAMIELIRKSGAKILVAGMLAPRNMDDTYGAAFNAIFPDLSRHYGVALYPFFLEGVAGDPDLNLEDGIHPNPQGVARMVAGIVPVLVPVLTGDGAAQDSDAR